jgi:hypothetical protein
MTERKPANTSFETWVEKQIREAAERGEFDNLPGAGKPIPGLHEPYDEMWWVRNYLRREGLSTEDLLPTPLRLRKEISRLPETVRALSTEREVRDAVSDLNRRIAAHVRAPSGPQVHVGPVNADDVVRRWRAERQATARTAAPAPADNAGDAPPHRRRGWWRRFTRRRSLG